MNSRPDILIVDDEEDIRILIRGILEDEGYRVRQAASASKAYKALEQALPDLIVLDIWLQGSEQDGLQILERVKAQYPFLPVLMISGHGTIETAVQAIKQGAYDFIEKPFKSDRLLLMIDRALEASALRRENAALRQKMQRSQHLVGASSAIQALKSMIERIAPTRSRVLIKGAAGTGKSLVARAIHMASPRASLPFVSSGGAEFFALNENAFSGGGTLFIDEIADMPLDGQARLVRFLQERDSDKDMRVIASTSQQMEVLIAKGAFREDLYYRINVMSIDVPSLPERKQDIAALVEHFTAELAETSGLTPRRFSEAALLTLQAYAWPGNIRQLKNVVEWTLIMAAAKSSSEDIGPSDLPPDLSREKSGTQTSMTGAEMMLLPLRDAREVFEREYLAEQIRRFDGNVSRTAQFVGMERSALHRKLKSLNLLEGGDGPAVPHEENPPLKKAKA